MNQNTGIEWTDQCRIFVNSMSDLRLLLEMLDWRNAFGALDLAQKLSVGQKA